MINLGKFPPKVATHVAKNELAALGIPVQMAFPSTSRDVFSYAYGVMQFASGQKIVFERHATMWSARSIMSMPSSVVAGMILDAPSVIFEPYGNHLGPRACVAKSLHGLMQFVNVCREVFGDPHGLPVSATELCRADLLRPCTETDEAGFLEEPASVEMEVVVASWDGGPSISCLSRGNELLAATYSLGSIGGEHSPALNPREAGDLASALMAAAVLRRPCDAIENVTGFVPHHDFSFESESLLLASRFPRWEDILRGGADDTLIRGLRGWASMVGSVDEVTGLEADSVVVATPTSSCILARLPRSIARCA